MTWETLPAFTKTTGAPMVSANLRKNKDGVVKLTLFLSSFIAEKLWNPTAVDIQVGGGEQAGLLRIVPNPAGAHKVVALMKGSKRITVPIFDGCPDNSAEGARCEIVTEAAEELIVRLPLAQWRAEIEARTKRPAPVNLPSAQAKSKDMRLALGRFDLVEYLTGKGAKLSRLAGGRFMLAGDQVMLADVLELANSHRKRADLPPLTEAQVF